MNILVTDHHTSASSFASWTSGRPLVRIVIVGHVDHGKSTLIGRLLHETGSLPDGKLETLRAVSARRGMPFEWSFLLDALQTERDQGITLDTSQIRFRTRARDVVLIDAPGHADFLRNMITGAAQADAALLIVDATEGVRDQTRRHGYLLHLLGVRQVAVVINKMDRVDFDRRRFREIEEEIATHLTNLGLVPTAVIPISARHGDGVAQRTEWIAWYEGPTVLQALDDFSPARPADELALRLPVQAIYKFDDRRIIAGRVETGRIAVGDEIVAVPSGKAARVKSIEAWPVPDESRPPREAASGQSVGITLDREIFIDRGDVLAAAAARPQAVHHFRARVFWLHDEPLAVGSNVHVRIGTSEAKGTVMAIENAVDPGHLSATGAPAVAQNYVGEVDIALFRLLAVDPHALNPRTGRVVLELGGRIAGGGLVLFLDVKETQRPRQAHIAPVRSAVSLEERAARGGHLGAVIWLTGLPGSGKSTLARAIERRVFDRGGIPVLLDGDTLRAGLNADLGFTPADRSENVRRLAEVAAHLAGNGLIAIVAAVSPSAAGRAQARRIGGKRFYEVYVATPPEVCEIRDPKGHYRQARAGRIAGFTGAGYEPPSAPDLRIDTERFDVDTGSRQIEQLLETAGVLLSDARRAGSDIVI
jgi:bifunctional enzyme CysN/CysC